MRMMIVLLVLAAGPVLGGVPDFYDSFDILYPNGFSFGVSSNGWQASNETGAIVTNSGAFSGTASVSNAVYLSDAVKLTNTLNDSQGGKIWTDLRIKPVLGIPVSAPPTNATSLSCYFNSAGYLTVATASGWLVCTSDVWGGSVEPATNGYARMSIFQDYAASNQVLFLNDQLVAQDLHFDGASTYSKLVVHNYENSCLMDSVWIKTNAGPDSLTGNRNGDALADALEVDQYGYARRTLYVGTGAGFPHFSTLQEAAEAYRSRDVIHVYSGIYANLDIATSMVIEGDNFSLANLTVATNASVTFSQSVSCETLSLTGQIAMAAGACLTATTATIAGTLDIPVNGSLVAGTLAVVDDGLVNFSQSRLVATLSGIDMTGTFTLSNSWGTAATASLVFEDHFEEYVNGTVMTNLGFRGWYASGGGVKVTNSCFNSSSNSVILPDGTTLSNRIEAASVSKVWTDFYLRPTLGKEPSSVPAATSSFMAYANSDGYLVVAVSNGEWLVCSNRFDNTPATALANSIFTRISVCQDLSIGTFAVFVAGDLVAQGLKSPANVLDYSSLNVYNRSGVAFMDDVLITTALPSGLVSDLNHNGHADAYEINAYGMTSEYLPRGTYYRFR